jgi:hypothetical protein
VDILIMILLFGIALLIWRGATRGLILSLWFVGLVAMIGLFRYHVTSVLDLSF